MGAPVSIQRQIACVEQAIGDLKRQQLVLRDRPRLRVRVDADLATMEAVRETLHLVEHRSRSRAGALAWFLGRRPC